MQTLIPHPNFEQAAKQLDWRHLDKQRKIVRMILEGEIVHPGADMWKGYELALAVYGWCLCTEWQSRGYADDHASFFATKMAGKIVMPPWLGGPIHSNHRAYLIQRAWLSMQHGDGRRWSWYQRFQWDEGPMDFTNWIYDDAVICERSSVRS